MVSPRRISFNRTPSLPLPPRAPGSTPAAADASRSASVSILALSTRWCYAAFVSAMTAS